MIACREICRRLRWRVYIWKIQHSFAFTVHTFHEVWTVFIWGNQCFLRNTVQACRRVWRVNSGKCYSHAICAVQT